MLDADPLVGGTTDDADIDVTAVKLRLWAGSGVGLNTNHLETTVGTVSARATDGGVYLRETDALVVDDVGLSVNRVAADATTSTSLSTDALQSDVRTTASNGNIVLRTNAGSITLNDGTVLAGGGVGTDDQAVVAHGTGNVLIEAIGLLTDITANADVVSTSGNISVLAAQSVVFTGMADVRTTSTAAGSGSIDVVAGTDSVTQSVTSLYKTTGATGTIRVLAAVNITVGDIESAAGSVSLTATGGDVLDADPLVVSHTCARRPR